jgi:hypothetical protein
MQRQVVMVLGKTGTGKSVLTKSLIENCRRVLILDPMGEYGGTVFFEFNSLANFFESEPKVFRCVLRPSEEEDAEFLFRIARTIGNLTLVVDEAEIYINPQSMPDSFRWLIQFGRHRGVSLVCVGRRAPELNIYLRAQQTSIISFAQTEPRDIDHLEAYGFNRDSVENLEGHEFETLGNSPDSIKEMLP